MSLLSPEKSPTFLSPLKRVSAKKRRYIMDRAAVSEWVTSELISLRTRCIQNPLRSIDAGGLTRHIDKLAETLRVGRQEDSHEFTRALLDCMCLEGFNANATALYGTLESSVQCQMCSHVSTTTDTYMDLSLEINDSGINSIKQALASYTRTETLSPENLVDCASCKVRRQVTKGLKLKTLPNVLTFHLKRFDYDRWGRLKRLDKHVEFPRTLDVSTYMTDGDACPSNAYNLIGIVCHLGASVNSGHYLAYTRRGDEWYCCNDARVTKVSEKHVLIQKAYLIFYERRIASAETSSSRVGGVNEVRIKKMNQRGRSSGARIRKRSSVLGGILGLLNPLKCAYRRRSVKVSPRDDDDVNRGPTTETENVNGEVVYHKINEVDKSEEDGEKKSLRGRTKFSKATLKKTLFVETMSIPATPSLIDTGEASVVAADASGKRRRRSVYGKRSEMRRNRGHCSPGGSIRPSSSF